jgi:hypothetical protein
LEIGTIYEISRRRVLAEITFAGRIEWPTNADG